MTERIKLQGLRCANAGIGLTAGVLGNLLRDMGVEVRRYEPAGGDPSRAVYPAYPLWHGGGPVESNDEVPSALVKADICIIGGESLPGLEWSFSAEELAAANPELVVLEIEGFASPSHAPIPAADILAQAATGFTNLCHADRANLVGTPLPSLGAALLGMIGMEAALLERARSGLGQIVRVSLEEGAALFLSCIWAKAERPGTDFAAGHTPLGTTQPVFETSDGLHLISLGGTPGAVVNSYRALDIDAEADPNDRGMVDASRGLRNFFNDRDLLEPAFARLSRSDALGRLWNEGLTAEAVLSPAEFLEQEQVRAVGLIREMEGGWRTVASPVEQVTGVRATALPRNSAGIGVGLLAGVRVLDLGSWVAGPFCCRLLADLGAEVIKVETSQGDPVRAFYKNFSTANRGKQFVQLDLKSDEGHEMLFRLIESADLVVHNFRIGVDKRLGIDPTAIHQRNPDAICVSISAFGAQGPKAINPGFDPMIQAYCGHGFRSGGLGNAPTILPISFIDYGTGASAAMICLYGLLLRSQGWSKLSLSTSLLHTGAFLMPELAVTPQGEVQGVPPVNQAQTQLRPGERLIEAADGWIAVAIRSHAMADSLHRALGIDAPRVESLVDLRLTEIETRIAALPLEALCAKLVESGVWCTPCVADAWTRHANAPAAMRAPFVRTSKSARFGTVAHPGPLIRFSRSKIREPGRDICPIGHDNAAVFETA